MDKTNLKKIINSLNLSRDYKNKFFNFLYKGVKNDGGDTGLTSEASALLIAILSSIPNVDMNKVNQLNELLTNPTPSEPDGPTKPENPDNPIVPDEPEQPVIQDVGSVSTDNSINISGLPSGIYTLKYETANGEPIESFGNIGTITL